MKNKTKKIIQAAVTIAIALVFMMPVSAIVYKNNMECLSIASDSVILENESNVVKLNGTIKAEWVKDDILRSQFLGLISPSINLSQNQTLHLNLTDAVEENGTISINKTLRIDVEVIGEPGRDFLFGRYLTTAISIVKQNKSIRILKNSWFLGKILTITRTSVIPKGDLSIDLPLQYTISNTTLSEKFYMHIFAWGMIPGNACPGVVDILPIIEYAKLNVDIIYEV